MKDVDQRQVATVEARLHTQEYRIRRLVIILSLLAVLAIIMIAVTFTVLLFRDRAFNDRLCQVAVGNRTVQRAIVLRERTQVLSQNLPDQVEAEYRAYYRELLLLVPPLECRDGKVVRVD